MRELPRIGTLASMGRWPAPLNPGSPPWSLCEMRSRASTWEGPDTGELDNWTMMDASFAPRPWRMQLGLHGSRLDSSAVNRPKHELWSGGQQQLVRFSTQRVPLVEAHATHQLQSTTITIHTYVCSRGALRCAALWCLARCSRTACCAGKSVIARWF